MPDLFAIFFGSPRGRCVTVGRESEVVADDAPENINGCNLLENNLAASMWSLNMFMFLLVISVSAAHLKEIIG